ncbi:uncharacterized protein LOC125489492 [Plutella xylostella]|uniref:uncharacterized protein LOC125489492 n=1 Tax=Plutella xylostella TaxID=51655 RepID=UPI0020323185|nr:uncharacterized protein LOC125489492 [Plutella xylostella]
MSGRAKKKTAAAPKKKANGYKMPAPIATGEVIHDTLMKKKWRIGPSIGVGGFGEIYLACQHENSPKKGSDYPFVIKIEPHENGPLFVEKHFYVRNANKDDKELIKFFTYFNTLKPRDVPDYTKCVQILEGYLKKHGKNRNSKREFTPTKKTVAKGRAKKLPESEEVDVEETASKPKENGVKISPRKKAKTKKPEFSPRCIAIWKIGNRRPHQVDFFNPLYESFQYPLLCPHGTPSWTINKQTNDGSKLSQNKYIRFLTFV